MKLTDAELDAEYEIARDTCLGQMVGYGTPTREEQAQAEHQAAMHILALKQQDSKTP